MKHLSDHVRRSTFCLTLILFACSVAAQAQQPDKIRLPVLPLPPAPQPQTVTKLTAEQLYVFEADIPVLVLSSPPGLLGAYAELGPMRIRGKFVDGNGKVESRVYKGKYVWTVEAVGTGKVELFIIPTNATSEADIIRRTLDVYAGPVPPDPKPDPPKPDPPVPPKPDPAPIPMAGLRVLIVFETSEATKMPAAQQSILYGQTMRSYLDSACVVGPDGKTKEYRIYDKDVAMGGESKLWQDVMKRPRASVPWLVVSNLGKGGFEGPLPATVAEAMAIIKKFE